MGHCSHPFPRLLPPPLFPHLQKPHLSLVLPRTPTSATAVIPVRALSYPRQHDRWFEQPAPLSSRVLGCRCVILDGFSASFCRWEVYPKSGPGWCFQRLVCPTTSSLIDPQSFFFAWTPPSQTVPIPTTGIFYTCFAVSRSDIPLPAQCETLHISWSRAAATGYVSLDTGACHLLTGMATR